MSFHSMTDLFMQLGLASDPESIARFIHEHQLPSDVRLCDAPFWSESQRQFLLEQFKADASWIIIVDQLNESLHEDALRQQLI
jgi:hypothetical protein